MVLQKKFIDTLRQADDEYEVIAVCYQELLSHKKDTDNGFITRIGHLAEDREYGSYAGAFEELRQHILGIAQHMDMSYEDAGTGFEEFPGKLIQALSQFECPEMLAENICIPIGIFYILEALDSYVEKNLEQIYDTYQSCGPLNKGDSRKCCSVYLQERTSFLSGSYHASGDKSFRKPLRPARIGAMFHAFLLFSNDKLPQIPKIIPIIPNGDCRQTIEERKIKISSIPYIGFDTFRFCPFN